MKLIMIGSSEMAHETMLPDDPRSGKSLLNLTEIIQERNFIAGDKVLTELMNCEVGIITHDKNCIADKTK